MAGWSGDLPSPLRAIFLLAVSINPCPAETRYAAFANSVDPDQLASEEAN